MMGLRGEAEPLAHELRLSDYVIFCYPARPAFPHHLHRLKIPRMSDFGTVSTESVSFGLAMLPALSTLTFNDLLQTESNTFVYEWSTYIDVRYPGSVS